jgi:hypothetical protein
MVTINGGKKQLENGWLSLPRIRATMECYLKRWFWSFPITFSQACLGQIHNLAGELGD